MKHNTLSFVICVATLMLLPAINAAQVGKAAPSFALEGIDGETYRLSDFAGKIVVLEWTNYGCPFVRKHYGSGNMQKLQREMAGKGVVWLSVCSSAEGKQGHMSSTEWKEAIAEHEVASHTILLDSDGTVGKQYGARATPHMYVIDGDGVLAYQGAIDSIPSASVRDIERAENYVVAAVDAVSNGRPVEKDTTRPYGCGIKWAR